MREVFRAINQVVVPLVKAGIGSPFKAGAGVVVLETTGRKSGLPREVPLAALRLGSEVHVSTVRGDSQWVKNLQADPDARIWLSGKSHAVTAVINEGALDVATLTLVD